MRRDGLFTRRDLLRVRSIAGDPQGIARVPSIGKADDVKARLRGLFAKAKSVDHDRKLWFDWNEMESTFVEVVAGFGSALVSLKIYL